MGDHWKRCSICKTPIGFGATYSACSVSTCNRKRTALFFCSVACWEAHLPTLRHRDPWAVEKRAPTREAWREEQAAEEQAGSERVASVEARTEEIGPLVMNDRDLPRDILVVASKLKKYVKARAGMNTSDKVLPFLSDHLRRICDEAIRNAHADGRKTLLERDIP